jgi:protein O-mannosyl-transferase
MSTADPARHRRLLGLAAIAVLTALAYLPIVRGGFIWDDETWITDLRVLRTAGGLRDIWLDHGDPQYYPLTLTTLWAEYQLWGANPVGYHLVNVALHTVNAALVWLLLERLAVPGAWLAAAVFAVHPVHVESVAWATELKNVQAGVFSLLALLLYLRFALGRRSAATWTAAFVAFVLAMLSKTVAATVPAAALVCVWWRRGTVDRRDAAPLVPFFLVAAAGGVATALIEKYRVGAHGIDWTLSAADRCVLAGRALWFYAGKLALPVHLSFIYPRWTVDAHVLWQWLFPLAAAAMVAGLWALRGQLGRGPFAAVAYFALTLAPALGFVDVYPFRYSFVADHFQYLASVGPLALAVACARRALPRGAVGCAAGAVVLLVLGAATSSRVHVFADHETLWRDTIRKNPGDWSAHNNLGALLLARGAAAEAEASLERALAIRSDVPELHHTMADALLQLGRRDEARAEYARAFAVAPGYAPAHNSLGLLLLDDGHPTEALAEFEAAIRLRPDLAAPHYNLGNTLVAVGRWREAARYYERAVVLDPFLAQAHNNLANVYAYAGNLAGAVEHWEKALALQPDLREARDNLASARNGQIGPPP